jgi:GTP diphosphokinase / guanosine-3',5'-bis(diphosphate) 3'-diphosphatase
MAQPFLIPEKERREVTRHYRNMLHAVDNILTEDDIKMSRRWIYQSIAKMLEAGEAMPTHRVIKHLRMAQVLVNEFGLGRSAILATVLYDSLLTGSETLESIGKQFGQSVSLIVHGLCRAHDLYEKNSAIETENFRQLLLTFAEDMRVILIMIADRLDTMRTLKDHHDDDEIRLKVAHEASNLYAPLAHRMGLYAIKTELEDLSLKYSNPDIYKEIAHKLNETKRSRDQYIASFIEPVKQRLGEAGFNFEVKGRTKSIHSIWNKMKKQNTPFENIYDLFAIRIILDTPVEKEKSECWQVYSIVTDMYMPNPKRLRDWLSIPKSNGYESLHITVMGPDGKWVEVQIRTRRMDEIAEKGVAAHWKYKGIKSESSGMDEWLKNLRTILENPEMNSKEVMDNFKLNLYDDDVFVFTPNGDLHKLKKGATVLDFAFAIHSGLGSRCVGAKVSGRNVPLKYILLNGDQVEILTSANQTPKRDWLNIAVTSKARTKIKQSLKEEENKAADLGRESLQRRMKNRKIEFDEAQIMKLARKHGYKFVSEFYQAISYERLDVIDLCEELVELDKQHEESPEQAALRSVDNFSKQTDLEKITSENDVLVIGDNVKNVQYSLAKCCNPIYGDNVFGFVSVSGGIKIHRDDCPNAAQLKERFDYRIIDVKWAGKSGKFDLATLHILGKDDIGIVSNITSVISKENKVQMRSISVNSHDGMFDGTITIMVSDVAQLSQLIKKLEGVKGVIRAERL